MVVSHDKQPNKMVVSHDKLPNKMMVSHDKLPTIPSRESVVTCLSVASL